MYTTRVIIICGGGSCRPDILTETRLKRKIIMESGGASELPTDYMNRGIVRTVKQKTGRQMFGLIPFVGAVRNA